MNNAAPFISVIIPAFNEESLLPGTLRAVEKSALFLRSRDRANTEVIVVDNNSADGTPQVARAFGAKVVAESEHNIARVRNRGTEAAQGTVLVFLDADILMPEELLHFIHRAVTASGCVGGAVDTDYRPKRRSMRIYLGLWRVVGRAFGMAQGATQFCLRSTFTALAGYDEKLFMGEDVDFFSRMRRHARDIGGSVRFIDAIKVIPSCRRYDQWPLWRTLVWTNPLLIAPLRRARSVWRGWYETPVR